MPNRPIVPENVFKREEQMAARAAAIEKITALLEKGPATVSAIWRVVGGDRSTLAGYLRYMQTNLRTVRSSSVRRGQSATWQLGADPAVPTLDEKLDQMFATKRRIVPAKQIGMSRCPLVAAIHGPATQQL